MKLIALLTGLSLSFAGAEAALAANHYDIAAIDDVNGNATFAGSMTTTAPFSLSYDFSVVDFDLRYLTKGITYNAANSNVVIETQGFIFNAKDSSSSFELTFYPDGSYFSEYFVPGRNAFDDSGYFAFSETPAVPEPDTAALLLAGLGALGFGVARTKRATAQAHRA